MEGAVEKLEEQLKLWATKIGRLAAKTEKAGARAKFEDLIYVDELKALHAIAQSKFEEFRAAEGAARTRLKAEMKNAWDELDAAFNKPTS